MEKEILFGISNYLHKFAKLIVLLYIIFADLGLVTIFSEDTSTKVTYSEWKFKLTLKRYSAATSYVLSFSYHLFLKHLTIKINGKSLRRFDRSSVIIKQDVRSKICIDIYSYKEVRMCENY